MTARAKASELGVYKLDVSRREVNNAQKVLVPEQEKRPRDDDVNPDRRDAILIDFYVYDPDLEGRTIYIDEPGKVSKK